MPGFFFGHTLGEEALVIFRQRLRLLLSLHELPSRPGVSFASRAEIDATARLAAERRKLSGECRRSSAVVAGLGNRHGARPPLLRGNVQFDVTFRQKYQT
jgi:hypothetical protein